MEASNSVSQSISDEVHNALSLGSASNLIISIIQPATIDSTLEQHGEDLPASLVIQPSQGSYSYLNSDISDYDEWVSPSPSDIDYSVEEHDDQNEHQLSNDWRNESYHERRPEIEESFEDLVAPSQQQLPEPYTSVSNIHHVRVATAPFRGRGVPVLETARASNIHQEPSEISDLGQRMYYEGRTRITESRVQNALLSGESRKLARSRKSLQDRLFEALQRKNSTTPLAKGFFPATALSTIITFKTVKEELRKQQCLDNYDLDKISQFARIICTETPCKTSNDDETEKVQSFRKIFAILVMLDKVPAIVKFLETNVNDSDLPLKALHRRHGGIYDLRRRKTPSVRLKCFPERWGCLLLSQFEEMQWTTLAPFFGKARPSTKHGVLHYRLPDKAILPFLGDDEESPTEEYEFAGGGGRVFKVKIHADHHTFHERLCPWATPATHNATTVIAPTTALPKRSNDCTCQFAIKKLHSRDKALFLKEVDVLKKFSNERHPHLISLLATYEQSQSFYLVFPWAEASLDGYWRFKNPSPSLDNDTVRWVAKQCHGIAHGVSAIHKYDSFGLSPSQCDRYGYHGDIKPENILWFPDRNEDPSGSSAFEDGTLKLTDFGLAAISTKRTMSRIRGTIMVSRCYCAPEIDLPDGDGHGRQYDMWTLGCLYIEFVTWLIGGWRLLSEFTHARSAVDQAWCSFKTDTFFTIKENLNSPDGEKEAIVKPQVTEFIEELHANPKCTEFLHELLDTVQSGLLIVKKSNGKQLERLSSQQLCGKLNDMLRKCLEFDSYGCTPCPREKINVS